MKSRNRKVLVSHTRNDLKERAAIQVEPTDEPTDIVCSGDSGSTDSGTVGAPYGFTETMIHYISIVCIPQN